MKLILHIGTEKTGSTSIQAFLAQNRKLLAEHGYWVPMTLGKYNHRKLPASFINSENFDAFHRRNNIETKDELLSFKKKVMYEFSEEIRDIPKNINAVIISSEHFHSRLVSEEEINDLKSYLDSLFDDYEIVVYLRRQIDMATSLYSTDLKSGKVIEDIDLFIDRITRKESHYFNYRIFLEKWERVFENIKVGIFEKNDLYMNDIVDDFVLSVFGEKYTDIINKAQKVKKANESLNVFGQNLMNILNKNLKNSEALRYLRGKINNKCIGEGKKPSYNVAKKVMDTYSDSNEEIRNIYFKDRENLFDQNLEKYRESCKREEKGEVEVLEFMVKLLNRLPRDEDINKIRNIALSLEKSEIEKSLELMTIVHHLKPEGKFIKNKVNEYRQIVDGKCSSET